MRTFPKILKKSLPKIRSHGTRHPGISFGFQRKHQTVEELLRHIRRRFGEVRVSISAVTVVELVHGIVRANTAFTRDRCQTFVDELRQQVPVHPITDSTGEIAGLLSDQLALNGIKISVDDLLIGASAIEQGYAIATLNLRHFKKIPGLTVLTI